MIATFEKATFQELGVLVVLWRHFSPNISILIQSNMWIVLLWTNDLWIGQRSQRKASALMVQMKSFAQGQVRSKSRFKGFCSAIWWNNTDRLFFLTDIIVCIYMLLMILANRVLHKPLTSPIKESEIMNLGSAALSTWSFHTFCQNEIPVLMIFSESILVAEDRQYHRGESG